MCVINKVIRIVSIDFIAFRKTCVFNSVERYLLRLFKNSTQHQNSSSRTISGLKKIKKNTGPVSKETRNMTMSCFQSTATPIYWQRQRKV